jgi:hypothetical protein
MREGDPLGTGPWELSEQVNKCNYGGRIKRIKNNMMKKKIKIPGNID